MQGVHEVKSLPSPTRHGAGLGHDDLRREPVHPRVARGSAWTTRGGRRSRASRYNRVFEDLAPSRLIEDTTTTVTVGFDGEIGNELVLERLLPEGQERRVRRLLRERPARAHGSLLPRARLRSSIPRRVESCAARTCRRSAASRRSRKRTVSKHQRAGPAVFADPESNRQCVPFDPFATHCRRRPSTTSRAASTTIRSSRRTCSSSRCRRDIGEGRPPGAISVGGGVSYRDEHVFQDAFGNADDPRRLQDFGVFSSLLDPADRSRFAACRASSAIAASSSRATRTARVRSRASSTSGRCSASRSSRSSATPTAASSCTWRRAMRTTQAAAASGPARSAATGASTRRCGLRATVSRDTRAGTLSERFDTQGAGANIALGQDPLLPTRGLYRRR